MCIQLSHFPDRIKAGSNPLSVQLGSDLCRLAPDQTVSNQIRPHEMPWAPSHKRRVDVAEEGLDITLRVRLLPLFPSACWSPVRTCWPAISYRPAWTIWPPCQHFDPRQTPAAFPRPASGDIQLPATADNRRSGSAVWRCTDGAGFDPIAADAGSERLGTGPSSSQTMQTIWILRISAISTRLPVVVGETVASSLMSRPL